MATRSGAPTDRSPDSELQRPRELVDATSMLRILKRQRRPEQPKVELATLLEPYGTTEDDEDDEADEADRNR